MKEKGTGIGYGKTILFGEHFVVYGLPGIAAALSNYTEAIVTKGKNGLEFIDNRPAIEGYKEKKKNEIQRELNALMDYFKIDLNELPLRIELKGNLECASGIGASAALAASIAFALNDLLELNLTKEEINEATYKAEEAGSGIPSGIDNTCAVFGKMIIFKKNLGKGKNQIDLIETKKEIKIVLANSGITQETKEVVEDVRKLKEEKPREFELIFKEYNEVFEKALKALKEFDLIELGRQMNKNHELLKRITVSCKELNEMQEIALNAGALGAKLTGTGRGGLMIALTPTKELQEKVAKAFEEKGYKVKKTALGG